MPIFYWYRKYYKTGVCFFGMGTTVLKRRGTKEYVYYVYYDNNRRMETYCGLSSDPKTDKKILQCEKEELTKQQKSISQRLQIIKKQIG